MRRRNRGHGRGRGERGRGELWAAGSRQDAARDGRGHFVFTQQCDRARTIGPHGSGARAQTFYGGTILEFIRKHLLQVAVASAPAVLAGI